MNLLQLRRATRSRLGIPTSDQMFTDDVLDDHINLANDLIASEHNWPWDSELVNAVPIVDGVLTPDASRPRPRTIRSVYYNNIEVHEVAASDLLQSFDPTNVGTPAVWADIGDGVVLVRPIPPAGSTAIVAYYAESLPLIEDTDRPTMPRQYCGSIVAKAAELLSYREDNRAAAEAHAREYAQWLTRMRRSLRRSTGPAIPRVREGSWI